MTNRLAAKIALPPPALPDERGPHSAVHTACGFHVLTPALASLAVMAPGLTVRWRQHPAPAAELSTVNT